MAKTPKDISVNKKIKADRNAGEYVLQMRRPRKFPWWILLLLLLPLLLLIKCKNDPQIIIVPGAPSPCDAAGLEKYDVKAGTVIIQSYNMGTTQGRFEFNYWTGNAYSDAFDIYNHNPGEEPLSGKLLWSSGQIIVDKEDAQTKIIPFNSGSIITIVVTTGPCDDSGYYYYLSCPL